MQMWKYVIFIGMWTSTSNATRGLNSHCPNTIKVSRPLVVFEMFVQLREPLHEGAWLRSTEIENKVTLTVNPRHLYYVKLWFILLLSNTQRRKKNYFVVWLYSYIYVQNFFCITQNMLPVAVSYFDFYTSFCTSVVDMSLISYSGFVLYMLYVVFPLSHWFFETP